MNFFVVLAVALPLYFLGLGNIDLFFQDDEWLYVKIASEMFDRGELWIPYWLGEPAYYKPPLAYWLMMPFFWLGEDRILLARLSVAFSSLITLGLTYLLGRELFGRREAACTALLASVSYGFLAFGRTGVMDMLLTCFLSLALWLFLKARRNRSSFYACLYFLVLGLSNLIKGPVVPLIILTISFIILMFYRGWKPFFSRWAIVGMLAGLLIAFSWPIALYFKGEFAAWYSFFIVGENAGKFTDAAGYPALPFIATLLKWALPWSLLVLLAPLVMAVREPVRKLEFVLPIVWVLIVIGVHLLPAVRLPWYTFPALPAALLLVGAASARYPKNPAMVWGYRITGVLLGVIAAAVSVAPRFFPLFSPGFLWLGSAALCLWAAAIFTFRRDALKLAVFMMLAILCLNPGVSALTDPKFPVEAQAVLKASSRPAAVVRIHTGRLSQEHALYSFRLNRKIDQTRGEEATLNFFREKNGDLILSDTDYRALLAAAPSMASEARITYSWSRWKDSLPIDAIVVAVQSGDLKLLQEPYHILQKR